MKTKQQTIEEYKAKGLEWCAKNLYTERKANARLASFANHPYWVRHECIENAELKKINKRLANIIEENGIRPILLRITYFDHDCYGCGCEYYDPDIICNHDPCKECKKYTIVTETQPFYSYQINGDQLCGITGLFEEKSYDAIKIVDLKTDEILYEYKGEEK